MEKSRVCLNCNEELEGRSDRKFCSDYCRSNFHYLQKKGAANSMFKKIDKQLKLNRRLLMRFNRSGKSTVRIERFNKAGFDSKYFTHYWKNDKGEIYFFCYEYGFIERYERGRFRYVLVEWQGYMER